MANLYKYTNFLPKAFSGDVNWEGGGVKVALLSESYEPSQLMDEYWSNVYAHEVTGIEYTAGGKVLGNPIIETSTFGGNITLKGDFISWPASTITARYVIIYEDKGTPESSPLYGFADLGESKSSSNGDFNINWSSAGIFEVVIQIL